MRRYADVDARQRRRTAPRDDYPRYDNARYDGGWFEWSKDPLNNPIESGVPREELAA